MNYENQVECPICGQKVASNAINSHIDANCPEPTNSFDPHSRVAPLFNKIESNKTRVDLSPSSAAIKKTLLGVSEASQPKRSHFGDLGFQRTKTEAGKRLSEEMQPVSKKKKTSATAEAMPLAAKVRPTQLSEFVGQEELLGPQGVLKTLIRQDRIPSMILWGPPGCGKTTLARIISKATQSRFIELSATSHGASDVRKAFEEARSHLKLSGQKTIVFIDEIHRFTKAQQDLFLPFVEQGTIHLVGATTENPSFKVNSALLSRCRVFVLQRLDEKEIEAILNRAVCQWRETTEDLGLQEKESLAQLAAYSDGDARSALNTLEIALNLLPFKNDMLTTDLIKGAFQKTHLLYDRNGDQHYDTISALHKSIRGSDADAALYWLGRMLEAGEDPLYIARRLVRCASEDIGLADNTALTLAMSAYHACEKIGMPECDTILAHLVVHLAQTEKSVRSYKAYKLVKETIRQRPAYPVPLHIRNAPTQLMKNLDYGKGYKYNPDYEEPVDQTYLPEEMKDVRFLE
ncbi:DNA polymerase III, clamp loader complex, gamma/delta/delta subunit [Sporodiniella umbellata]|nr:DNA polymerase III, clamp loader complex, gamma/delta/delta subunit [Sporodiniella umbellata]